jgi:hypothetical protein
VRRKAFFLRTRVTKSNPVSSRAQRRCALCLATNRATLSEPSVLVKDFWARGWRTILLPVVITTTSLISVYETMTLNRSVWRTPADEFRDR